MNNQRTTFFRLHHTCERDRVGFCHVAAHNQDTIAIDGILRISRSTATTKCCTQTGYCRAVSYTGLVLDGDDSQSTIEQLLYDIVLFDIQRSTAQCRDAQCMIDFAPIF